MANRRPAEAHAIASLCIVLIASFAFNRAVATAAPLDYSVEFEWADERTAKGEVPSGMSVEMSIDGNVTEITDAFAFAAWAELDDANAPLNTLVFGGNGSKCLSFSKSTPNFMGDFKSCATLSVDNKISRVIELISEWDRKIIPIYKLIVSIKFD